MRSRRYPRKRPGNSEWDRIEESERIAEAAEEGWRERVFASLFDPSPSVRDEASRWLLGEPETRRFEHALVLRDPHWDIRYNATAGWLADPECTAAPEWVPDLFAGALARERDEVVARQILLMLGRWAPDRLPRWVPSQVRDLRGYATAGLALAEIRNGTGAGWTRLATLLDEEGKREGITFASTVLGEELDFGVPPGSEARAYTVSLQDWLAALTWFPARREEAIVHASPLIEWAGVRR